MRAVYLVLTIAAVLLTCFEALSVPTDSSQGKPNSYTISPPAAHDSSDIGRRSLRGAGADDEPSETVAANDEERAISWSTLSALVRRKEVTDADLVLWMIQGVEPAKILKKMDVKPKIVNGIKVYSKYDPEYKRFRQYFRFVDSIPELKRS